MTTDCLIELGTEELPPKALRSLSEAFAELVNEGLAEFSLQAEGTKAFASPRRLAIVLTNVPTRQPEQQVEKRGPAVKAAYDAEGNPTKAALGFASVAAAKPRTDGGVRIYMTTGNYEDVRLELESAIVDRGFVIDFNGKIGDMLKRTAEDVGAKKSVFRNAEFFTFCSASVSRKSIEVDPRTLGFCPYTLFIYELESEPGQIRVGYRRPALIGSDETRRALTALDKLLDRIARTALQ